MSTSKSEQQAAPRTEFLLVLVLSSAILLVGAIVYMVAGMNGLMPQSGALEELVVNIYPYQYLGIDRPENTDRGVKIVLDSLNSEQRDLIELEIDNYKNRFSRLSSSSQVSLLLSLISFSLLAFALFLSFHQLRKHSLLIKDYRSLRTQYEKLLGNKRIADAELKVARDHISNSETKLDVYPRN